MNNPIANQLIALSVYLFCMGYCFCDGFKLATSRKLIWFGTFAALSIYSLAVKAEFDLVAILPVPSLLAILLGSYEIRARARRQAHDIRERLRH
ncbi:MAG: hypothetical protein ABH865_02065 [Candidatus Omnitrophota bacterium]|nr:hypothetical protein [Candidatus Omnitrophota bacterium]